MTTFFHTDNGRMVPTTKARGPWDVNALHGGPPSALLLHHMRAAVQTATQDAPHAYAVARLSTEFLRPVPLAPLHVDVELGRVGRVAVRASAQLFDVDSGKAVMSASAVFLRQDASVAPSTARPDGHVEPTLPPPSAEHVFDFSFFPWEDGYHRAVEVHLLDPPWGSTPARFWAQPTVRLVDDVAMTPEEATVLLADAESGMGPPLDPRAFNFANPDLTVFFARRPRGLRIGLDVFSVAGDAGVGLSEARLFDDVGMFGRSAQSLVVTPRR